MDIRHALSLIREFTVVDLKLRYKESKMGYLWSLLNPLLMLLTLYIVFGFIAKFDVPHYQLYLLLGILIWNFLSEATNISMQSMISKGGLLKKYNFPEETIVISSCLSSFIVLLLNMLIFFVFMYFSRVAVSWTILLFPFYLLQLFLLVLGVSFFLSSLFVKYKDLQHIWSFVLLLGFFISPIVYPLSIVPVEYLKYYLLNPLARMVVDMRYVMIYEYAPDMKNFVITLIISLIIFVIGYYVFRRRKEYFVEDL